MPSSGRMRNRPEWDKGRNSEILQSLRCPVRGGSGLDLEGDGGGYEKWLDPGHTLYILQDLLMESNMMPISFLATWQSAI